MNYFLCLYNPLFLAYGRDETAERWNEYDPFPTPCYDGKYPMMSVENDLCNSPKHLAIKKILLSNFYLFEYYRSNLEQIKILSTHFFISVAIATSEKLREKFFCHYNGKVPAITQFLLNCLTIGPIDNEKKNIISEVKLDENFQNTMTSNRFYDTLCDPRYLHNMEEKEGFSDILKWFSLLEEHCFGTGLFFTHFVPLIKTPMYNENFTSLLGFNQEALNFFIHRAIDKNTNLKEKYQLLNETLRAKLVAISDYSEEQERKNFENDKKNYLNDDNDEKEEILVRQLFDFIMNCGEKDLVGF